jgi:hypothetical protein
VSDRTWRSSAGPKIARVIAEVGTEDMKALRKALREAYPYGERKYWPYKVWCDEIRRQLALGRYTPISVEPGPDGPLIELMEVGDAK